MTGNRIFLIAITAAILAVVALGWVLGISPVLTQASSAGAQAQQVQSENALQQAKLDSLITEFKKLPALEKKLTKLQKAIPGTINIDAFLDDLNRLAVATGTSLDTITAESPSLYGQDATMVVEAPDPSAPVPPVPSEKLAAKFFSVPLALTVSGPEANVLSFVNELQHGRRLYLVVTTSITSTAGTSSGIISGFLYVVSDPLAIEVDPTPTPTDTPAPTPSDTPTPTPTP